jgi:hypothetical protein
MRGVEVPVGASNVEGRRGGPIQPSDKPVRYASAMLRLWREQGGNTLESSKEEEAEASGVARRNLT